MTVEHYKLARLCERVSYMSEGGDYHISYGFRLSSTVEDTTGFYAASFINDKTGNMVIVFKGTDSLEKALENESYSGVVLDLISGAQAVFNEMPDQLPKAREFATREKNNFSDKYSIVLAGHSFGGCLVQIVGAELDLTSVAFDTLGAKRYLRANEIKFDPNKITIYNSFPSVVNALVTQVTKPHYLEIATKVEDCTLVDFLNFFLEQHKIENIADFMEKHVGEISLYQGKWPSNPISAFKAFVNSYCDGEIFSADLLFGVLAGLGEVS